MARLQADLSGLMRQADAVLASPPAPQQLNNSRRHQIEALTAALTATTATLRAHSAAAVASSAVMERERRLVAAETALMATQAAALRRREAQLLLQAETLRGSMTALQSAAAAAAAAAAQSSQQQELGAGEPQPSQQALPSLDQQQPDRAAAAVAGAPHVQASSSVPLGLASHPIDLESPVDTPTAASAAAQLALS
jgi:hypothetical protein